MKINIYQINTERDTRRIAFCNLSFIKERSENGKVDSGIYDKVYSGEFDCENLEKIFEIFNLHHPSDYKGWSLSVSDIVEVIESDTVELGCYFCDSFGFQKIEFDTSKRGSKLL